MSLKAELDKRIERKKAEISELEAKTREAQAVLAELQGLYRFLPKDESKDGTSAEIALRPHGDVSKARDALRVLGHNSHIDKILEQMGKPVTSQTRKSLAAQLAWYARRSQIFTKTAPRTFGLIEWGTKKEQKQVDGEGDEEDNVEE